jgi:hypothetical protein
MKKRIIYFSHLWLLTALMFTGCKKDTADTPAELSVSPGSAFPETFLTIRGHDMQNIVSIKFDTTTAGFSSVFNTGEAILTTVPANARYGDQLITLTNRAGNTAVVNFTVLQPAPVVNSFTPANAPEGDTITITGKLLTRIQSVLIGSTPAIIIDSSSKTQLKVKIPTGASSGLISVVTAGGSGTSASIFNVGERAILIADFEGAGQRPNGNSWYSYGDINTKAVSTTNPAPKNGTGSYLKAVPNATSSTGYAGISTYASGSGNETFGLTSTTAATTLKFDVNNNGKTATVLQVIVQESTTDNNSTNFAKNIPINGSGWNTISIPLTQLFNNYGGGTLTPTPANITKVKFHFSGYASAAMEANIDNVRFAY